MRDPRPTRELSGDDFHELVDHAAVGIARTEPTGRFVYANDHFLAIAGRSREELLGLRIEDVVHPGDRVRHSEHWREAADGRSGGLTCRYVRPDGEFVRVTSAISVVRGDDGTPRYVVVVARELSGPWVVEPRRAEDERNALALRATAQAIWDWDLASGRVSWSAALKDVLGYGAENASGAVSWWESRIHPDDRERVLRGLAEAIAQDAVHWSDEYRFRRADGAYVHVTHRGYVVRDFRGRPLRVVGAIEDVSTRKEAEEALRAADRRKDEFLAMLGHELRNPLAPIVTALELMKLKGGVDCAGELAVLERQVGRVKQLVDDLLDVSRITRGKIELRRERVALGEVIAEALEMASPLFESRQHHVTTEPMGEAFVDGDHRRLVQVFVNLLTNAAKYTPPGGHVRVSCAVVGDEVAITVADDGVGIAPELLPRIFEPFVQSHRSLDRAEGGLGLGLSLVKSLVSLHGGSVTVVSDGPGCGSAFTVRLPVAAREGPSVTPDVRAAAPGPDRSVERRRVLVVDDNEDAADTLAMTLEALGYEVIVAYDGPEALRRLEERPCDVAVLDIGLPVMDGYELAARVRERAPGARLLALTGYGQASDRARSREAGFDIHLVKPVEIPVLLAAIEGDGDAASPTLG